MAQRTLELQLVSAKNLKNVNLFTKMDVYAVVSLNGDAYNGNQKTKTKPVLNCGTDPTFNFTLHFSLDDSLLIKHNVLSLEVKLVSQRLLGDKVIGAVHVPLKELFDSADPRDMKFISYQVRRPSGKPKGELTFSYKFGEKVTVPKPAKKSEPVMAYPVGATKSTGYPPHRYPTVQQKQAKKKSSGMGFGTGLIGGMLVADMLSHIGGGGCGGRGCGGGCC